MDLISNLIKNNNISQINLARCGPKGVIPCEYSIPIYLLSREDKKVVVCLFSNLSVKLSYEYMKTNYPTIRVGYADIDNISCNLSTEITYVTPRYLQYKILKYYQNNNDASNFTDIIILVNPNMNDDSNIFIVSSLKYADDNKILFPKLCILNSEYSYKLSDKLLSFKNQKKTSKHSSINYVDNSSIRNITNLIQTNYKHCCNFLIRTSDSNIVELIKDDIPRLMIKHKVFVVDDKLNNLSDLFNAKMKKIIIATDDFYFENIDFVINVITYNKPPNYKNILHLVIDYINCDINISKISLDTNKYKNIDLKDTVNLMIKLNLLTVKDNKLAILAAGFFSQTQKLKVKKASFIWEWILKGYPLYQGIILVLLIDDNYSLMLNKINHLKWYGSSPLHNYLNMINSFNQDNKDNIDNIYKNYNPNAASICTDWANRNKVDCNKFLALISNVGELHNNITKVMRYTNLVISDFNVQDLINLASPMLKDIYSETILIVKDNNVIQPHENIKYIINRHVTKNILRDERIIPFILRPVKNINENDQNKEIISVEMFLII